MYNNKPDYVNAIILYNCVVKSTPTQSVCNKDRVKKASYGFCLKSNGPKPTDSTFLASCQLPTSIH